MLYQVGDTIGGYKVLRELGSGAYGEVYLVEWNSKRGKKQGALKVLNDAKFKDILKEVSTWARVSYHNNILSFLDAAENNRQVLLISEYAPDGSLVEWIRIYGGQETSLGLAVELGLGFLAGLAHLHDNEIVHRDIKPANILLKGTTPLLADFGFARGLDLVQSSVLGGTLAYMSPELIKVYFTRAMGTQAFYERTEGDDLWASTVTLYEMLAGKLPFKTVSDIDTSNPDPLPSHVPQELQAFINKGLEKVPSRRFQTSKDMYSALLSISDALKQRMQRDANAAKSLDVELRGEGRQISAQDIKKHWEAENANAVTVRFNKPGGDLWPRDFKVEDKSSDPYDNQVLPAKQKSRTRLFVLAIAIIASLAILGVLALLRYRTAVKVEDYINAGEACHKRSDFDCAIDNFTKAIELNPHDIDIYFKRGNAFYWRGKYDEAIADYNKVIDENPFGFVYKIRGLSFYKKDNVDQSLRDYDKAIELDPQDGDAYFSRGNAYSSKAKYDQAIVDYDKALSLEPNDSSAFFFRGKAYFKMAKYLQAMNDFDRAIQLNQFYRMSFGPSILLRQDTESQSVDVGYDQAIRQYGYAIKSTFQDANAFYNRGRAYFYQGFFHQAGFLDNDYFDRDDNYRKALKDFNDALRVNPLFAGAYFSRALTLRELEQTQRAKSDWLKFQSMRPDAVPSGQAPYWINKEDPIPKH